MGQFAESKRKKAESTVTQSILIVPGQVLVGKLFIVSPGLNKNRGCGDTEHGPTHQNKTQFLPQSVSPTRKLPPCAWRGGACHCSRVMVGESGLKTR